MPGRPALAAQRPNLMVILVDDLGYGDLSSYGATDLQTPHIDRFIGRGMRFDRFYANCPVCSPTRAALLTGRYPDLVGVPGVIRSYASGNWGFLDPDAVLLPQVLKSAGYDTAIIGKWHLGLESPNTPPERGFDHFHGFLGDMMDDYYTHRRHDHNYMRLNHEEIDPQGHATDLFTDWSIEYLKSRQDSTKPFFLYLAYNAPHTPIQPPQEWEERVLAREKNIDPQRAKLVALIEHLDYGIGRVLDALSDFGLDQNTLVVFTSDNGGQSNVGGNNGPLNGGKQDMYEGGIRVPMAAVWPNRIQPASQSMQVAMTMDLFPTLCQAADAPVPDDIEGRSFLPTLLGTSQISDDRSLVWVRREGHRYQGRAYYAIRKGDYKLMQNTPFEEMKLFNLAEDPGEKQPLPSDHPMARQLQKDLQKHIQKSGSVPWQEPG
ncbi:sulfatase-like hydrolase/transferase [candidate division KSB1 bacterium]|nr:sulfatase-like hydrolase/transferase [candidate division KSB1 bacterium]